MPRKKRPLDSYPLQLVVGLNKDYPGIWEKMREAVDIANANGDSWNPLCVIPSDVSTWLLTTAFQKFNPGFGYGVIAQILYSWRKYKKVYSFNKELAEILIEGAEIEDVLAESLLNVPFPAFYLEFAGWKYDGKFTGAFISFDAPKGDMNNKTRGLEIEIALVDGGSGFKVLPLVIDKNTSILDSLKKYSQLSNEAGLSNYSQEETENDSRQAAEIIQLVLYLCSINSEVTENDEQKKVYRKSQKTTDTFREIQKWDVGVRIGKAIRSHRNSSSNSTTTNNPGTHKAGTRKRPHVRRAHFHNYWVGSGNAKHLVLKFLAPSYINFASADCIDVVKHDVT